MHDDFHSAAWADNHRHLSRALYDLYRAMKQSMEVLTRQQFYAPWQAPPRRRRAMH